MTTLPLGYRSYRAAWDVLDWLFPPNCGGCGKFAERWCEACHASVRLMKTMPICPVCGSPNQDAALCASCRQNPPAYRHLRSWGAYDGALRSAILKFKFYGDMGVAEALSKPLIERYNELGWQVDVVVPVPLGNARARQRGYNQSGLLARPLALATKVKYQPSALERIRETNPQVQLGMRDRRKNVEGAFQAHAALVAEKTVLVIDDVTTTGSTILACSQALIAAGASAVFGLTLARAVLQANADDPPEHQS